MARRQHPGQQRSAPHSEVQALLKQAYPPSVKQALLLAQRGGRLPPRRCLVCDKPASRLDVWVPHTATLVLPGPEQPRLYRLCNQHQGKMSPDEIGRLLTRQRPG